MFKKNVLVIMFVIIIIIILGGIYILDDNKSSFDNETRVDVTKNMDKAPLNSSVYDSLGDGELC